MPLTDYAARWARWRQRLTLYAHACRLHRPFDLVLFLMPALWLALLPAARGEGGQALLALLLAATAVRCAAWLYNDLMDARMAETAPESFVARRLLSAREGWLLLASLLGGAALLLLPWLSLLLLLYASVALALLLLYPLLKRRTLLTQPYLGLCYAWIVPMAQPLFPGLELKGVWLLFTAVLLWATAHALLCAIQRRDLDRQAGIGSLLVLFGDNSGVVVLGLQLTAVVALWRLGAQGALGGSYSLGLVAALLSLPHQQWLLSRGGAGAALRAYLANHLFALAILLGILFSA